MFIVLHESKERFLLPQRPPGRCKTGRVWHTIHWLWKSQVAHVQANSRWMWSQTSWPQGKRCSAPTPDIRRENGVIKIDKRNPPCDYYISEATLKKKLGIQKEMEISLVCQRWGHAKILWISEVRKNVDVHQTKRKVRNEKQHVIGIKHVRNGSETKMN